MMQRFITRSMPARYASGFVAKGRFREEEAEINPQWLAESYTIRHYLKCFFMCAGFRSKTRELPGISVMS